MRNALIIAVLSLAATVAMPASAADENGTYSIVGLGMNSCGTFVAAADKGTHQEDWREWNKYLAFMSGYITAFNLWTPNMVEILGSTDTAGAMAWVEKYCRENPLHNFATASGMLVAELIPNARRTAL